MNALTVAGSTLYVAVSDSFRIIQGIGAGSSINIELTSASTSNVDSLDYFDGLLYLYNASAERFNTLDTFNLSKTSVLLGTVASSVLGTEPDLFVTSTRIYA